MDRNGAEERGEGEGETGDKETERGERRRRRRRGSCHEVPFVFKTRKTRHQSAVAPLVIG